MASIPNELLPVGRWIYTTTSNNSQGTWFFIGEKVQHPETSDSDQLITPNATLEIQGTPPPCTTKPLQDISTEDLVTELMKRSPSLQKQIILDSMNNSENEVLSTQEDVRPKMESETPNKQIVNIESEQSDVNNTTFDNTPNYTFEEIAEEVNKNLGIPPPKGLNEPSIYEPTILITPPLNDPEKPRVKRRKHKIEEYNPIDPLINCNKPEFKCDECRRTFGNKGSYTRKN
jgi:hypothetical protein